LAEHGFAKCMKVMNFLHEAARSAGFIFL
jgi:hypothetical protein